VSIISVTAGARWEPHQLRSRRIYHVTTGHIRYPTRARQQARTGRRIADRATAGRAARGGAFRAASGPTRRRRSGFATPAGRPDACLVHASGSGRVGGIVTRHNTKTGMTRTWRSGPTAHSAGRRPTSSTASTGRCLPVSPARSQHAVRGPASTSHMTTDGGNAEADQPDLTLNARAGSRSRRPDAGQHRRRVRRRS